MSESRKVTIVSTRGQKIKSYETPAKTWGELVELIGSDYDLSGLKAVENINKTTLEHIDAVLPEEPFRVFLRPEKTKSGVDFSGMSFKELRKKYVSGEPSTIKFLETKFNKNWTRMSTNELREGLIEKNSTGKVGTKASDIIIEEEEVMEVPMDPLDTICQEDLKVDSNLSSDLHKKRLLEQCTVAKNTTNHLKKALSNIIRIVGNSEIITDQEAEDMAEFAEAMEEYNTIAEGFLR